MQEVPNNNCIRVENVSKSFGERQILSDLTFQVQRGSIFGLLGPSGSGKTSTVQLIAGIDRATSGHVYVFDELMPKLSIMSKIGYMMQADALYAELTAEENIDFFGSLYGLNKARRKARMAEVIALVDLGADLKRKVRHFSGGMKRRLSLAIALVHEPPILLLDEPTVGIDPILRRTVWKELFRLRDEGTAVVVTTHVMDEADKCDQLGLVRNGKLLACGSPEQLKAETSSSTIEDAFLCYGEANV